MLCCSAAVGGSGVSSRDGGDGLPVAAGVSGVSRGMLCCSAAVGGSGVLSGDGVDGLTVAAGVSG